MDSVIWKTEPVKFSIKKLTDPVDPVFEKLKLATVDCITTTLSVLVTTYIPLPLKSKPKDLSKEFAEVAPKTGNAGFTTA
jgi:hypothetical protein